MQSAHSIIILYYIPLNPFNSSISHPVCRFRNGLTSRRQVTRQMEALIKMHAQERKRAIELTSAISLMPRSSSGLPVDAFAVAAAAMVFLLVQFSWRSGRRSGIVTCKYRQQKVHNLIIILHCVRISNGGSVRSKALACSVTCMNTTNKVQSKSVCIGYSSLQIHLHL